jgi:hypothetical protein
MGVDHGGAHIRVAEQLLHRANVVARLQQMRGKGVAQRVRRGRFVNPGLGHGTLERALKSAVRQVVALDQAAARIGGQLCLREEPKPRPTRTGAGVFALQSAGHMNPGMAGVPIRRPQNVGAGELLFQRARQGRRQHHRPVFIPLALAHHQGHALEINVLHPQAQAFHQAHARAVEHLAEQAVLIAF